MVNKVVEFKSFIRIEKNNSKKRYNLWEKGLGAQDLRGIFPVKVKILKLCELI